MCHVGDADLKGHGYVKRVYAPEGKSPSLCASSGGNLEPKVLVKGARMVGRRLDASGTRKDHDKSIPIKQMIEVRDDDKTNCLTTVTKDSILVENMSWRKLTPLECERLQTVPDGYTEGCIKYPTLQNARQWLDCRCHSTHIERNYNECNYIIITNTFYGRV